MHIASLEELHSKKIVILGFGKEGKSTLDFLLSQKMPCTIMIADQRAYDEFDQDDQVLIAKHLHYLGAKWKKSLDHADVIIRSPGINPYDRVFDDVRPRMTSQTQLFFDLYAGNVIAVTGTKGKSTTASLLAHVLKTAGKDVLLVGNVGLPVLSAVSFSHPYDYVVYEVSSFQLCDVDINPSIAIVTNLGVDHLSFHDTVEAYHRAKYRILGDDTVAYVHQSISSFPGKDPHVYARVDSSSGVWHDDSSFLQGSSSLFPVSNLPLLGRHNADNACAVLSVAIDLGIDLSAIEKAFGSFVALEHRLEFVIESKGIRFFNDSQATSPVPSFAAIASFGSDLGSIMLGGTDSGFDYAELVAGLQALGVDSYILFPDTIDQFTKLIGDESVIHRASSMEEAVELGYKTTPKGKVCLLSPAAKSFSIFDNVYDRGKQFKKYVLKYAD